MESKHTPGPWEVDALMIDGRCYGFSGVRTASQDGYKFFRGSYTRTVAQTPHAMRLDDSDPESSESLANMSLISAAPELLAALKGIAEFWAYGLTQSKDPTEEDVAKAERLGKLAWAAIAKAEGR